MDIEDLFQSVDVIFCGDVHNYERTCPVYKEQCKGSISDPGAPIQIVAGTAGQGLMTDWIAKPSWSIFREATFGIVR